MRQYSIPDDVQVVVDKKIPVTEWDGEGNITGTYWGFYLYRDFSFKLYPKFGHCSGEKKTVPAHLVKRESAVKKKEL